VPPLKPKARDDLALAEFDEEVVAYVGYGDHGLLHYLDPTATLVFRLCDGSATVGETAAELAEFYGMPAAELEPQVRELVRDFRRRDLLTHRPVSPRRTQADGNGSAGHDGHHEHAVEREVDGRVLAYLQVPASD
jgi:Coenzyme PQQ synthesis protein D (PqqD)